MRRFLVGKVLVVKYRGHPCQTPLEKASFGRVIFGRVYPPEELTFVGEGHLGDFPFSYGRYHGWPWCWTTQDENFIVINYFFFFFLLSG